MLRIALEASSMRPPRPGIGRYTWELECRWEHQEDLQIHYLQWHALDNSLAGALATPYPTA